MFKLLALTLISLVGMDYANVSDSPSLEPTRSTQYVVNGGVNPYEITSGFYLPCKNGVSSTGGFTLTVDDLETYYPFVYGIYFTADYVYYKTYANGVETMHDTRDVIYSNEISYYSMTVGNYSSGYFAWVLVSYAYDGTVLNSVNIASYSMSGGYTGSYWFYEDIDHYIFYVHNFNVRTYNTRRFYDSNGDLILVPSTIPNYPLNVDNRFNSLERYFYFPYQPNVFSYWYKPYGTYYIDPLGNVGVDSRPTIFKGFFKNQGKYYSSYNLYGINSEQPSNISGTNGYYFGPYNNVSSLSQAIKPASNTSFWYAINGLFTDFNNGILPVWYTLTTPVNYSGTVVNVISNEYQWYSTFYQEIYLVYEQVDTSGNLTSVNNLSYYDMLAFNTGYNPNTGVDVDPFTSALTLVGVAFQRIWSIGNIVLFGSITLNTLILMPILVGLVIFVIHLIKKG